MSSKRWFGQAQDRFGAKNPLEFVLFGVGVGWYEVIYRIARKNLQLLQWSSHRSFLQITGSLHHEEKRAFKVLKPKFDILGLGAIAVDDLIYAETYPQPDTKTRVRSERQCGGLTGMALIAAARLGAKCVYAGVLGKDELSQFAIRQMQREKIDLKFLRRDKAASPGHSFIVIDSATGSRTVFSESSCAVGAAENWPGKNVVRSARVLVVDHKGVPGMIRAAKIAREEGIPIVADFERADGAQFSTLLWLADHLILSAAFARQLTGEKHPARMAKALWDQSRKAVAITHGEKGCWYLNGEGKGKVFHQPAFNVRAIDTTGCGDVFHGAYAWALTRQMTIKECIRFASASAALKAAQRVAPTRGAVEKFLKSNNSSA